jgi:pimeloyl-ACP methyl ester carboxylesterase
MSNETTVTINFVGNERRPAAGRRVIGFVHGLRGDARDTWTNKENGVYWPTLVREDPAFGDVDVFCVDYKSGTKGSEPELGDLVSQLRKNLEADGIFHYDAVSFVGHSLGSILLRWLLCDDVLELENRKALWKKTRLVMTFSAPYKGCRGATAAGAVIIGDSAQLESVKPGSTMLAQLDEKWRRVRAMGGRQPAIRCAWEEPQIKGDWFMEKESSIHGCDEPFNLKIQENHFNVVKPNGRGHPSYVALREAYQRAFAAA